jgi:hypothetical protein
MYFDKKKYGNCNKKQLIIIRNANDGSECCLCVEQETEEHRRYPGDSKIINSWPSVKSENSVT